MVRSMLVYMAFGLTTFALAPLSIAGDQSPPAPLTQQLVPPPDFPPGNPSPPSTGDARMTYYHLDPAHNTVDMQFSNGVVVTIDDTLGRVFIGHGTQVRDFPLSQMFLAASNGNVQQAAAMHAQLQQTLSNPLSAIGFTESGANILPFGKNTDGFKNDGLAGGSFPQYKQGPGGGGSHHTPSCTGFWECLFFTWEFMQDAYIYWEFGAPDAGPSDPDVWNGWHYQQCDDVGPAMQATGWAVAGTAASCAVTPLTGAALGACLAGLGATNFAANQMGRNISNCNSFYRPH